MAADAAPRNVRWDLVVSLRLAEGWIRVNFDLIGREIHATLLASFSSFLALVLTTVSVYHYPLASLRPLSPHALSLPIRSAISGGTVDAMAN